MLNILKRHRFLFLLIGTFYVFGLRTLHYYLRGQIIASAHLDEHHFAPQVNIILAVILTIIFLGLAIKNRQAQTLKWLLLPAIIAAFAPFHISIGRLFDCCPCCCSVHHVHQWNIIISAAITSVTTTILLTALSVWRQIRKSRRNLELNL